MAKQIRKVTSKKIKSNKLPKGVVHIQSTFNNTIVTIINLKGKVISWSSAGSCGFKGARKSTPFAAKTAAEIAARQSMDQGLKQAKVMVKGAGPGRETAIRGLIDAGLQITLIRDITGIAHNGCRPPKKRRV
jgi:small subunit ribosomal protein S11|uniref:Small ribosomal subunit protein uS11c n=12 Tax=Ulva TaxID=3118 RepID=A0A7L9K1X0_9CHLO|nr:30S ribosomal protein S11 [Ulva flexuosa]YP_009927309.1 30S ribosomal protein S11 [Ulva compressa]YP_010020330.1 30S ribosomal protein S11 [Ulva australis]YP_010020393.1 30S ribosomal protein S11 [Ulva fenestrata]YP_010020464.1 30S ribosomal protein S11 [Ulva gigantea]YP_010020529.1 30S ribosomal protein S11 [Ulva lacinulata]YP_010020595.1 30S ribosomal protein S11 [Ulva sp. A AF-2021]YP_010020656.1 30S ribosomal protein S11 [Ulva rigida]YP_010530032.1 ribosomal protein S11 [Ulva tepida]